MNIWLKKKKKKKEKKRILLSRDIRVKLTFTVFSLKFEHFYLNTPSDVMQKLLTFFQQKISEYCILNLLK